MTSQQRGFSSCRIRTSSSSEPNAHDECDNTEWEIRVSDSTNKRSSVVPSDGKYHHCENNIFKCDIRTHIVSNKKNKKSTTGREKLCASNHAIKRRRWGTLVDR